MNRWQGRAGAVILGPTEHRVALWLEARTRRGRVTFRTMQLAGELGLERSEAYRITARLRILGLFGIANDHGGHRGGRYVWRTARAHDGARLDPERHRRAWARVLGAARARADHLRRAIAAMAARASTATASPLSPAAARPSFRELFEAAPGGSELLNRWGAT